VKSNKRLKKTIANKFNVDPTEPKKTINDTIICNNCHEVSASSLEHQNKGSPAHC